MPPPQQPKPDPSARFGELLGKSHSRWIGIARAYAAPADRDDLLQEIALQVWKSLEGFAGASSLETWAYRVALNTALAWRRKSATRATKISQAHYDVAQLAGSDAEGDETNVTAVLDRFLASLNDADRAVMLLHLDGVAQADAAEVLGVAAGAYRTRLHRIRQRFEEDFCQGEGER
ncbi:ECF RNA polymerase sigma-E factor [Botrimarina colliarenosi]|uniref:ECF RNA polymerase sigma-E factor n=1 Tax=Botrimarina colliarenosi TaxID=2528001 RepID=A0A5C6ALP6_9BACT|nr:sigma-70 family RNA polymerase sigma factor [Botrimarina colliarenosi]TWU00096.1 ECF RNA polymerase sigma-E factor [Botrimarina colliarenosi]